MRKIGFKVLAPVVMVGTLWGCDEIRTQTVDATASVDSGVESDAQQTALDANLPDAAPMRTTCEEYCSTALANCTDDNQLYVGMDECLTSCAGLPEGTSGDTNVNSVYCRSYHATIAGENGNASTHCPHASVGGAGVCVGD